MTAHMARPETLRQGYCDAGVSMRELIVEGLLIDADWALSLMDGV